MTANKYNSNKNLNDDIKNIVLISVDYLTQMYSFATLRDTEEIYYYDIYKGIFVPNGEQFIKGEVVATYRDISTKDMNEIINHIKWETYIDRIEFDAKIEWVACENCMINLLTGETKPFSPDNMATVQIPVYFNENSLSSSKEYSNNIKNSPCPKIMKFLYEIIYNKKDVETLLDFLAYCLWREMKFHKILILDGEGRNGKGTLCTLITTFFGTNQISSESLDQLLNSRFSTSQLVGKFINIDADLTEKKIKKSGILKKLSGNDLLSAEEKYKPQFKFRNFAKIIVVTNELPEIDEDNIAIFSRLVVIDFPKTYIDNANPDLIKELTTKDELSGLLTVLLKRLPRVLKHGISYTKSVEEIARKYRLRMNSIMYFADEYLQESFGNNIRKDIMYKQYKDFCYRNKIPPKSEYAFSQQLSQIGFSYNQLRNGKDRSYYWINVRLQDKSF